MKALEIKNLIKHFDDVKAVDDISFEVKEGDIFGFLGPNGAGKTTTIRLMLDFIHKQSGSISIFGKDSHCHYAELKRDIGYIPSEETLYDNWNGYDHIKLFEGIFGKSDNLRELLNIFDFDPKRKVIDLSSGNKRKLAIILALMHKPKLLISDEPTSGLDPLLQNRFYETILKMNKEGMTVFMSSHNLGEVEKTCTNFGIIKSGKLITCERIKDLHHKKIFNIDVIFFKNISPEVFNKTHLKIISHSQNKYTFQVRKDINEAIHILSKYKLENIEIYHASLEDIFMEFYGVKKTNNNNFKT